MQAAEQRSSAGAAQRPVQQQQQQQQQTFQAQLQQRPGPQQAALAPQQRQGGPPGMQGQGAPPPQQHRQDAPRPAGGMNQNHQAGVASGSGREAPQTGQAGPIRAKVEFRLLPRVAGVPRVKVVILSGDSNMVRSICYFSFLCACLCAENDGIVFSLALLFVSIPSFHPRHFSHSKVSASDPLRSRCRFSLS